jgi:hypothetical protein
VKFSKAIHKSHSSEGLGQAPLVHPGIIRHPSTFLIERPVADFASKPAAASTFSAVRFSQHNLPIN